MLQVFGACVGVVWVGASVSKCKGGRPVPTCRKHV